MDSGGVLSNMFGGNLFKEDIIRETWIGGIQSGIESGLNRCVPGGKVSSLYDENVVYDNWFMKLVTKYKCCISHHPHDGMIVKNRDYSK